MRSFQQYKRRLARLRRIYFPKQYDHAAWLLMGALGRPWLLLHGFKREYRVGRYVVDLACPKKKIALEADGARYHQDVVREHERDEYLAARGWTVRHLPYRRIKDHPALVRREIKTLYHSL